MLPSFLPGARCMCLMNCTESNAACSDHGVCSNGLCHCWYYFMPPQCGTTFADAVPAAWHAFVAGMAAVMAFVVVNGGHSLYKRLRGGVHARTKLRDAAAALNVVAAALRIVWLVDPLSSLGTLPPAVSGGLMLRLPQVMWLAAYLLIVLLWGHVHSEFVGDSTFRRRTQCGVAGSIGVLLVVAVPASILDTLEVLPGVMRALSDGVFAVYAVAMMLFGCVNFRKIRVVLEVHHSTSRPAQQRQLQQIMQTTRCTMLSVGVLGSIMVVSVVCAESVEITPQRSPVVYVAWLSVVHLLCEGGVALTALYSTRRVHANGELLDVRAALCACVKCRGTSARNESPLLDGV